MVKTNAHYVFIFVIPKRASKTHKHSLFCLFFILQSKAEGDRGQEKEGRKKREYVPQKRSGGYAVLLTLYRYSQV